MTNVPDGFLPPFDWYALAHAAQDGGDYLLWKGEFLERCQEQAHTNRGQNVQITFEMLAGPGQYSDLQNQRGYVQQAYEQIKLCGRKAWLALPAKGDPEGAFIKCMQGPQNHFLILWLILLE